MKLFEPGKIGKLPLSNRIIMAPMAVGGLIDADSTLSQRGIDYYVARAAGGTALLITGATRVSRAFEHHILRPRIDEVTDIAWVKKLADAVHAHGARLAIQLTAGVGRVANPVTFGRTGMVAPSAAPCVWDPSIIARELTRNEIDQLVSDFVFAARVARESGVDAVQLHGHEGYLLDQFKTALWNKRTDEYGGSLAGRMKFSTDIIAAIKKGAGDDFPIIYRFGLKHYWEGGREVEEGVEIARRLEAAGVAALDIDAGCYENWYWPHPPTTQPRGCMIDLAEMAKKAVKIPVIAVGRLGYPDLAEKVLQEGKADFVMMGRALLADPEWPNKVKAGKLDDIRPCLGDHECLERSFMGKPISCTVNPSCGREKEYTLPPLIKKRSVLVIGGGPGGMEAARVSALRGHSVTLLERGAALGGNLAAAAVPDFKADYRDLIAYLSNQIKKLGVEVKLGVEATPEMVQKMKPDVLFIATGATSIVPDIPGLNKKKAITAVDVLTGGREVGKKVIIVGGGAVGCETALYLAQQGKTVTVVEALESVMPDIQTANRQHILKLLGDLGTDILIKTTVRKVLDKGVLVSTDNGERVLEADNLVFAVGLKANDDLQKSLKGEIREVHQIGDCVEPRKVIGAIWDAFTIARVI